MKGLRLRFTLLGLLVPAAAVAAVPVTTAPLGQLLATPELSAPATVVARNTPTLASEISAPIEAFPVHVGDLLEPGTLVARLDCRTHESRLRGAKASAEELNARREFAASQLKRARDLQTKKGISDEVVEQRAADLASLDSQLTAQREAIAQAELDVGRCTVTAPFAAVVTERLADEGGLAAPGTPLARLVQLDELEVSTHLGPAEARDVSSTDSLWLLHDEARFPLQLRRLLPVIDERTRTREARLVFTGDAAPPGASGRLLWQSAQRVVPAEYLVRRDGRLGIFYLNGAKAHFHILPGAVEGQPAAIDMAPDTPVIVEGRQRLSDGDDVTVAD